MPKFALTPEQEDGRDKYRTGEWLKVIAYAGSGKTATLTVFAEDDPDSQIGFIAFNKSIARDAAKKFPRNTDCRTAHSHAFRAVGKHKQDRLEHRVYAKQHAQILGIRSGLSFENEVVLSPYNLATLVKDTVRNFCYSAEMDIDWMHVPYVPGADMAELRAFIIPYAKKMWADKLSKNGRCAYTHDDYFKEWSLDVVANKRKLPYDVVMVDEAQDSNPALIAAVMVQTHAQVVLVGDPFQQIYSWRGAVDALADFPAKNTSYLTKSFRFGEAVADEANKWLKLLDAPKPLFGYEQMDSVIVESMTDPDAVLCRTNAEAVSTAMNAGLDGKTYAIVGGTDEIKRFAESAQSLMNNTQFGVKHPDLIAFKNWGAVKQFVEEEGAGDLKVMVKLIDDYGPATIIRVAEEALPEERGNADITISTAHKAKGREWDRVRVAPDFKEPVPKDDGSDGEPNRAENMLLYVVVTRAKLALDCSSVSWVNRFITDENNVKSDNVDGTSETS